MAGTKRAGALLLGVAWLFYLAQYMYAPYLTPYAGVLGGSLSLTGLIAGSYGALQLLLRIPFGLWSDSSARRKPFVVWGTLLAGVSALGMGFARSPQALLLFRALSGVAAATWVLFIVLYTELFSPEETGRRVGLLTVACSSGQLAGNLTGAFLAERGGWAAPFLWAALPGLAGGMLALALPESAAPRQSDGAPASPLTLRQLWRPRAVLEPSLLALLSHFVFYATILGFTPVYVVSLGFSKLTLGLLSTAAGAAYVLGTLLATWAGSRGVPWALLVGGSFAAMAAAAGATPFSRTLWPLGAGFVALGFCRGTTYPALMAAARVASPPGLAAASLGFFQATYALGMFAGPAVGGVVAQGLGLRALFPVCAALSAGGCAWCLGVSARWPALTGREAAG